MLDLFGDGDPYSQKRLRAPQDVGLGRRKNFGNRQYPPFARGTTYLSRNNNNNFDYYYDEVESGDEVAFEDYENEYEIQRDQFQAEVDAIDSISVPTHRIQAESDPADTRRLSSNFEYLSESDLSNNGNYAETTTQQKIGDFEQQVSLVRMMCLLTTALKLINAYQDGHLTSPIKPKPAPILLEETREYKVRRLAKAHKGYNGHLVH